MYFCRDISGGCFRVLRAGDTPAHDQDICPGFHVDIQSPFLSCFSQDRTSLLTHICLASFPKAGAVLLLRFALFAPYFLPPPVREAALCVVAASGEIPNPSQHLCRGFLHGNEGHIWHHRPSFQPARPYPASRQAAVRKSHYPQVRCHGLRSNAVICFVRLQVNRSPLSGVLAPWPGGFSSRPG